jgi:hypothetical protein
MWTAGWSRWAVLISSYRSTSDLVMIQMMSVNSCLQEYHAPACPLQRLRPPLLRPQTWRQSILVLKNHALLRSVDARSGGCGRRSGGRAPLRLLRPVLRPVQRVLPRRRVQPPLRRLMAARAAHEPRVMIDSQCNAHTAICVQYRVGSPGWIQKKALISKKTKFDIEAQKLRYRLQISKEHVSISRNLRYRYISISKF